MTGGMTDKIETLFYHRTTRNAFLKGKRGDSWDFGTQSLCSSWKQLGNPINVCQFFQVPRLGGTCFESLLCGI